MAKSVFLTSNIFEESSVPEIGMFIGDPFPGDGLSAGFRRLNPESGLVDTLREEVKPDAKALYIPAEPSDFDGNDRAAEEVKNAFAAEGMDFVTMTVLDNRNCFRAKELLPAADVLFLGDGSVQKQNAFLERIGLLEFLPSYEGVVIAMGSGTWNAGEVAYTPPENETEASDPNHPKFLLGLNLTEKIILPKFDENYGKVFCGKRLYEDIIYPESMGLVFFVLLNGTYLLVRDGQEKFCGSYAIITEGILIDHEFWEGSTVEVLPGETAIEQS